LFTSEKSLQARCLSAVEIDSEYSFNSLGNAT